MGIDGDGRTLEDAELTMMLTRFEALELSEDFGIIKPTLSKYFPYHTTIRHIMQLIHIAFRVGVSTKCFTVVYPLLCQFR